jgi:hypothetical protein
MTGHRYSWLAIASVLLNLPWMVSLVWCFWVRWSASNHVAGELFLLPVWACFWIGIPGGICGIIALLKIQSSEGTLRGQWVAALGVALATIIPVLTCSVIALIFSKH